MKSKIMNPVSWLLVFVFRVTCSRQLLVPVIGLVIVCLINYFILFNSIGIYLMVILAFFVSLVASISTVLQEDF